MEAVLEAIVAQVPPPQGDDAAPLRALIFDSHYDPYKGVVAYVRVMDGAMLPTDTLRLMASGAELKPVEIGIFAPSLQPTASLTAGEVGYVATGLEDRARVPGGRYVHPRPAPGRRRRCPATARSSRWSSPASTRWKAKITPT